MSDVVTLDGEEFTREEVQMLYHGIFTVTNGEAPGPRPGPTAAMRAQMKLAKVLGEDVPEAALQRWEQTVADARAATARRQAQFAEEHNKLPAQKPTST